MSDQIMKKKSVHNNIIWNKYKKSPLIYKSNFSIINIVIKSKRQFIVYINKQKIFLDNIHFLNI